jgi:hypothetical protein
MALVLDYILVLGLVPLTVRQLEAGQLDFLEQLEQPLLWEQLELGL